MNTPGRTPAFGIEPKFALQISIGALPLWRSLRSLSPQRRGENPFPTPFGGSNPADHARQDSNLRPTD